MFNLNIPTNVEKEKDTLGGRTILESGLYKAVITKAYGTTSKAGAKGMVMAFEFIKLMVKLYLLIILSGLLIVLVQ